MRDVMDLFDKQDAHYARMDALDADMDAALDIPERDPSPPDDPGVRRWRRERDYYERADVEYERSMDR